MQFNPWSNSVKLKIGKFLLEEILIKSCKIDNVHIKKGKKFGLFLKITFLQSQ